MNLINNILNYTLSAWFISVVVVFTLGLGSFAFSDVEGEIKRLEESILDSPPIEPYIVIPEDRVFPPKYVEAGYFPTYVGDVLIKGYPIVLSYSERDRKKALDLETNRGYGEFLNRYVGGSTWFRFLIVKSQRYPQKSIVMLNSNRFNEISCIGGSGNAIEQGRCQIGY
ncbi:MAG: hypothetical protein OXO49_08010 [Gammaproteobacteria bacterium]|nr:hypothetical protein [Gammaproteobacteria bacterium]MDE0251583.1 hypothetical protein [Gammaproteobacteria bacterium]MDE0403407.1 hypothetical protein [Gammaproteobacteria bacterium]